MKHRWLVGLLSFLVFHHVGCKKHLPKQTSRSSSWKLRETRFFTSLKTPLAVTVWSRRVSTRKSRRTKIRYEYLLKGIRLSDGFELWVNALFSSSKYYVDHDLVRKITDYEYHHWRDHLWVKNFLVNVKTGKTVLRLSRSLLQGWRPSLRIRSRSILRKRAWFVFVESIYGETIRFDVRTRTSKKVASLRGRSVFFSKPIWPKRCIGLGWFTGYRKKTPIPNHWPSSKTIRKKNGLFKVWFFQTICPYTSPNPILIGYIHHLDDHSDRIARIGNDGKLLWKTTVLTTKKWYKPRRGVYFKNRLYLFYLSRYKWPGFYGALDTGTGQWVWKKQI